MLRIEMLALSSESFMAAARSALALAVRSPSFSCRMPCSRTTLPPKTTATSSASTSPNPSPSRAPMRKLRMSISNLPPLVLLDRLEDARAQDVVTFLFHVSGLGLDDVGHGIEPAEVDGS